MTDALSNALSAVRVTGAVFFNGEFTAPWGFEAARVPTLRSLLPVGTGRLLIYHLVLEGEAVLRTERGEQARLRGGDVVVLPHEDTHTFSNGVPGRFLDGSTTLLETFRTTDLQLIRHGDGGAPTRFICGYFGCERRADRLFLAGLPSLLLVHIRSDPGGQWLENTIRHLVGEDRAHRPGSHALLAKMAEALLIEILRRHMESLPAGQTGWLAGARDPVVGSVLSLFHAQPARRWTLAGLEARVGASRSVIGQRFHALLGEPPLSYLARWRLQLAARCLEESRATVLSIADQVGYESEAAFCRAFRREFGMSPTQYRRDCVGGAITGAGRPLPPDSHSARSS